MPKPTTQTNLNRPNEPYQNHKAQTNAQYNNNTEALENANKGKQNGVE